LALYLCVLGAGQVLEWRVERSAESHIERAGGAGCPAAHDEALCQICQAFGNRSTPPVGPRLAFAVSEVLTTPHQPAPRARSALFHQTGAPRAPPARLA
jgi:hypothetical protein